MLRATRLRPILLLTLLLLLPAGPAAASAETAGPRTVARPWDDAVVYHVFVRSFRDSDGDRIGDLDGIRERLGYLQALGVTTLLLSPLYPSSFYHNYFPSRFSGVEPGYGGEAAFARLAREVHRRRMRLIVDMELQYVTGEHDWLRWSYASPRSPFAGYVLYDDSLNLEPEPGFAGLFAIPMYTGRTVRLGVVNLANAQVRERMEHEFVRWADPDGDGDFADGVDGFRLDHIMDDLDWKGRQTGLLAGFWRPLIRALMRRNPSLLFVGEQSDWGYGADVLDHAGAGAVFAFPLSRAIRALDKRKLAEAVDSTLRVTGADRHQLVFAENHDMDRLATALEGDRGRLRAAAALTVLLGWIPSIYYGQELGMTGALGTWGHDGNDIPVRAAFPWSRDGRAAGTADWYRGTGPWAASTLPAEGSAAEQMADSASLWHHYRRLIALRQSHAAFRSRSLAVVDNDNPAVFSFRRGEGTERALVVVNLRGEETTVRFGPGVAGDGRPLWPGSPCAQLRTGAVTLRPYALMVCGAGPATRRGAALHRAATARRSRPMRPA